MNKIPFTNLFVIFSLLIFQFNCTSNNKDFSKNYDNLPNLSKKRIYTAEIQEKYLNKNIKISGTLLDIYKKDNQYFIYFISYIGSYTFYLVLKTNHIDYKKIPRQSNFLIIANLKNIYKWIGGDLEAIDDKNPVYYVEQITAEGELIDYSIKDCNKNYSSKFFII